MQIRILFVVVLGLAFNASSCKSSPATKLPVTPSDSVASGQVQAWVTTGSQSKLLKKEAPVSLQKPNTNQQSSEVINLYSERKLQQMEGFGAALTGSSAYLINQKLSVAQRTSLLHDLFDPSTGIGLSYLRTTMGASDFSLSDFTYNDMPSGQTDPALNAFSIEPDRADLLPILKSVVALQPNIPIMATPWSAPAWMKTSGKLAGGHLKKEYYDSYAKYFIKYLDAYQKEGIRIDAISVQNEPLHEAAYPSMAMDAMAQAYFIKNHLGPQLKSANKNTKILLYDHNWDRPDYPLDILKDAEARQYVAGSAFHAYGGSVDAMSEVHQQYPDKGLYFTEISGGRWATNFSDNLQWNLSNILIGTANNWSKNALLWNLALDDQDGPQNKGCNNCRGVVTIHGNGSITKNVEYYSLAHLSKFVRPGAYRIEADAFAGSSKLERVAFINPDGSKVLVVLNTGSETRRFTVLSDGQQFNYSLEPKAVVTLLWKSV